MGDARAERRYTSSDGFAATFPSKGKALFAHDAPDTALNAKKAALCGFLYFVPLYRRAAVGS